MVAAGVRMKAAESIDVRRAGGAQAEWTGIGWTDSSWELAHGLDVVEDLPADAWPAEPMLSASHAAHKDGTQDVIQDTLNR
jgi:hypothetical protein